MLGRPVLDVCLDDGPERAGMPLGGPLTCTQFVAPPQRVVCRGQLMSTKGYTACEQAGDRNDEVVVRDFRRSCHAHVTHLVLGADF